MTLREYLDLNNMTLTDLSRKTDLSISLLSKIMNNKEKASERTQKHFEKANIKIDLELENKTKRKEKIENLKNEIEELRTENRYLKTMIMKLHDNLLTQKLLLEDLEKIMKERIKRKDIVGRKKLYKTKNLLELKQ